MLAVALRALSLLGVFPEMLLLVHGMRTSAQTAAWPWDASESPVTEECCCYSLKLDKFSFGVLGSGGCPPNHTYVPEKHHCCQFKPSSECIKGSDSDSLRTNIFNRYMISRKPEKCKVGPDVVRQLESAAELVPEIQVLLQGEDELDQNWVTLAEDNYKRVRAIRYVLSSSQLEKLYQEEKVNVEMKILRQGEVRRSWVESYNARPSSLLGAFAPSESLPSESFHFQEGDLRKEFQVEIKCWREALYSGGSEFSQEHVLRQMVYVAPIKVCGIGFFESSNRDCEPAGSPQSSPLKTPLPAYALGVEYELVGAPLAEGQASLVQVTHKAEYEALSSLHSEHNLSLVVESMPCTGACAEVKQCLWKKLGWSDNQSDAWHIEVDLSVKPMKAWRTNNSLQHQGVPFEIVSPGPPNILVGQEGMMQALNVLTAIKDMGGQSPLSAGLHLHINVRNKKVGSDITLSLKEIMSVYTSWARFQYVIDEMISPDRIGNLYAKGLYLDWGLNTPQRTALHSILKRGHEELWHLNRTEDEALTTEESCAKLIGTRSLVQWCHGDVTMPTGIRMQLNPEKYFQINLTPIGRFGTIEFRAGSATLDPERAARWFQFLVAFVDTFKDTSKAEQFFDGSFDEDIGELTKAQRGATAAELKEEMRGHIEEDFFEYFAVERPFEGKEGTGCVRLFEP